MRVIFVYLMFGRKCIRHACKNDKVNGNLILNIIYYLHGATFYYYLLLLKTKSKVEVIKVMEYFRFCDRTPVNPL